MRGHGTTDGQLDETKGQTLSAAKRAPMKQAQSIRALLSDILDKPGIGEQITRHQAWLVWDQVVGKQIANHARPLRLRKGVLEVQVDHPVWMQQLQMLKPLILEKITASVPRAGITDIYLRKSSREFTPKQRSQPQSPTPQPWQQMELTEEEQARIDDQLASITDPELRRELRALFTRQIKLNKTRHH